MPLITPGDQERLRESFEDMTAPVRLLFFTQTFDCDTCLQARQILDELPPLSDRITIEEANVLIDKDRAAAYGIDRAPAVVVLGIGEDGEPRDSRIRFLGAPSGYEFVSLVQAILLVGGHGSNLTDANRERVASVGTPVTMRVFSTPTCPHCPRAVSLANEMAFANPNITAFAVEATSFPDLARSYRVTGVPKTVVNSTAASEDIEILGGLPQDEFIQYALADFLEKDHREDTEKTKQTK
jgi:glutaredoxin-like protein